VVCGVPPAPWPGAGRPRAPPSPRKISAVALFATVCAMQCMVHAPQSRVSRAVVCRLSDRACRRRRRAQRTICCRWAGAKSGRRWTREHAPSVGCSACAVNDACGPSPPRPGEALGASGEPSRPWTGACLGAGCGASTWRGSWSRPRCTGSWTRSTCAAPPTRTAPRGGGRCCPSPRARSPSRPSTRPTSCARSSIGPR